jgi:hypothetical protein
MEFLKYYLMIGLVLSIPLARAYVFDWRSKPSKYNIQLPNKFANRTIEAFVFIIAWITITVLYPIYLIELLVKRGKKQ